jgi:hypothetical protein
VLVSSYITLKARKGDVSAIQGRGLIAVAPVAAGELAAIKGGHIVTTAALASLPERLRNSEVQIADGFHLAAVDAAEPPHPSGAGAAGSRACEVSGERMRVSRNRSGQMSGVAPTVVSCDCDSNH